MCLMQVCSMWFHYYYFMWFCLFLCSNGIVLPVNSTLPPPPPPHPSTFCECIEQCHPSHQKCAVLNVLIIIIVLLLLPFWHGGVQCWVFAFTAPFWSSACLEQQVVPQPFSWRWDASVSCSSLLPLLGLSLASSVPWYPLPGVAGLCLYISVARREGQQMKKNKMTVSGIISVTCCFSEFTTLTRANPSGFYVGCFLLL